VGKKVTGKKAGSSASKTLRSRSTGKTTKTFTGSALSRREEEWKKWETIMLNAGRLDT